MKNTRYSLHAYIDDWLYQQLQTGLEIPCIHCCFISPPRSLGSNTPGYIPDLVWYRPVSRAARDGLHTGLVV